MGSCGEPPGATGRTTRAGGVASPSSLHGKEHDNTEGLSSFNALCLEPVFKGLLFISET